MYDTGATPAGHTRGHVRTGVLRWTCENTRKESAQSPPRSSEQEPSQLLPACEPEKRIYDGHMPHTIAVTHATLCRPIAFWVQLQGRSEDAFAFQTWLVARAKLHPISQRQGRTFGQSSSQALITENARRCAAVPRCMPDGLPPKRSLRCAESNRRRAKGAARHSRSSRWRPRRPPTLRAHARCFRYLGVRLV